MTSERRYGRTPWFVLAASLLLTAAAAALTAWSAQQRDLTRFENAVESAHDRIVARLEVYINTLRGGAALFAASNDVSADEFRRFAQRMQVQRLYPGIQGVGWTERIAVGAEGGEGERHAIVYLEPLDARNQAAIGYDMFSEPTRRAAMIRARDRAEPSLSGKVVLVQEIFGPKQAGFLIYVPVYDSGDIPATVAQRRAELRGFVYSPFRADDLFAGIFGTEGQPRVSFAVYDGPRVDSTTLLHRSTRRHRDRPRFQRTEAIEIAGRHWTVRYASEPAFEQASLTFLSPVALLTGLFFSGWLFWLALAQSRARVAAETAASAKGRFLATMSHELRTPLNAIGGYVDLLQLEIGGAVTPQQHEYLSRVQRAQQHLLGLINNILNFAKLENGGVPFELAPIPLAPIIAEAQSFVAPQLAARTIEFRVHTGPAVTVDADAEKLRQILLNLLSNATKFTDPGGSVSVQWYTAGPNAFVSVEDTGIGIAPEKLEQIFDPFVQVDPDLARTRQGTGLGLAISRELARRMGGDISAASEPGRGSTFTLRLPLHAPH